MNFTLRMSDELIDRFAIIIGDHSSIHTNVEFARTTRFRSRIAHGVLPLLFVYREWLKHIEGNFQIKSIDAQFERPVRPGDELEFLLKTENHTLEFVVQNCTAGCVATQGVMIFEPCDGNYRSYSNNSSGLQPLDEMIHSFEGLAVGDSASLVIDLNASKYVEFGFERRIDPRFLCCLYVSTLIGMKLPGRLATFLDYSLEFTSDGSLEEKPILTGQIEKKLTASSKIKGALRIVSDQASIACGLFSVLVNKEKDTAMGSSEIRQQHLPMGVQSKVALITGASRGIGEATAKLLALQGAKVVVQYFQGKAAAESIVEDIRAQGGKAMHFGCDLTDRASIVQLFEAIHDVYGPVDILVNSAVGSFVPKAFADVRDFDFMEELRVSLFGNHACTQEVIPHMKRKRWGKIINLGTIATETPVSGQNSYITVKSALVGYTRSLAVELAPFNIQANMVVPNMTNTTLLASLPESLLDKIRQEKFSGRLLEPVEVAKTIAFLASEWANPITGQQIVLNQGENPFL